MVTASTYQKEHLFNTPELLTFLQNSLLDLSIKYNWQLNAWAVFPNHYHFIAYSETPHNLNKFIQNLHGMTSVYVNKKSNISGRKVWFQYWDTNITFTNSHYARINYVINNPVKHKLVTKATDYEWCSASWFEKNAEKSFMKMVYSFKTDLLKIDDDF